MDASDSNRLLTELRTLVRAVETLAAETAEAHRHLHDDCRYALEYRRLQERPGFDPDGRDSVDFDTTAVRAIGQAEGFYE